MLRLITGQPGAGKTLNTIKYINENCEGRTVYYYGIKDIDSSKLNGNWIELEKDQLHTWYELPEHSVFLIDESQYVYPIRNKNSQIPPEVLQWSTHRHRGYDGFIITQAATLVDTAIRKFVNEHWHFSRPYNSNTTKQYVFQTVHTNPDDYFSKRDAELKKVKLDKKYFDLYFSTTNNTHQFKAPRKLIVVLSMTALCLIGVIWFVFSFAGRKQEDIKNAAGLDIPASIMGKVSSTVHQEKKPLTNEEYIDRLKPRILGLAYTAPFYDELVAPKSFPKPSCVVRIKDSHCQCYSQQATKLDVPPSLCLSFVKNGWFDFTRDEKNNNRGNNGQSVRDNDITQRSALKPVDSVAYDINGQLERYTDYL